MGELFENIHKLHTTELGIERIQRNLGVKNIDVVEYCLQLISDKDAVIYRNGKNWYCETRGIRITINSYSYTIITTHEM